MDKNALKTFAVESRRKLIEDTKYQASLLGISADEIKEPVSSAEGMETYQISASTIHTIYDEEIEQRKHLVQEIKDKGFENVIEEVAYTWFNRIIAIRYMEVNDYLPTRTRVLSSETPGKVEPDIVTDALNLDLDFSSSDTEKILDLKENNRLDELFQFLFIKQCNKLNEILPDLFEKTDNYSELLLSISFNNPDGIVRQLIDNLSEEDFAEVEIIGWLYQYYISEQKDLINNVLKSKAIKKEEIPAVTQLFTPEWIVKYMVDNSLGKYWMERNEDSSLKNELNYFIADNKQSVEIQKILDLQNQNEDIEKIKFLDPCMGSGHILVYAFDVFFKIYQELGYIEKEIPQLILENNLFGLDIDKRAFQLAYFALMMKARKHDRRIFKKDLKLNICPINETEQVTKDTIEYIKSKDADLANDLTYLSDKFANAKEYGSLIQVEDINLENIESKIEDIINESNVDLSDLIYKENISRYIVPLLNQSKILVNKYEIVVTNPPYMNKYDKKLKDFTKKYYKDYSRDLFSTFIYRNFLFCKKEGYVAFMTPMVWMFIKNYEKLRNFIIKNKNFVSLIELEYHTLWEIEAHVPACTFVLSNQYIKGYMGKFIKLTDFTGGIEVQNKKFLEAKNGDDTNIYYSENDRYLNIPGAPIAYWADKHVFDAFNKGESLDPNFGDTRSGMGTSDNKRFLRHWYEVNYFKLGFGCKNASEALKLRKKWYPYNKGGKFKKWYGNQDFVVNYENDGFEVKEYAAKLYKSPTRTIKSISKYFLPSISWSKISSGNVAFRYYPPGFIFDVAGCSIFLEKNMEYMIGFLNSNISSNMLDLISPTLNYEAGHIGSLPIIFDERNNQIRIYVRENIEICKNDWDDYETSWEFKSHPFLRFKRSTLEESFNAWKEHKSHDFNKLQSNEIELNKIFSQIYSIDVDPNVEDKYVSVTKADYESDVKSFISYAVGCMLGRYSLDEEGIAFAGGEFNLNNYSKYTPDDDNVIPVLDTGYFEDDIVGRFVEFVKTSFGEEVLELNLDFIAAGLKNKGNTSREVIRNYFLNDFFKDHAKTYQKYPIYWQFDSGKENGFKCLIYLHRYEPNLVARVRTDYLHKTQKKIEENLTNCENVIQGSSNKSEVAKSVKLKNKLIKQLTEIKTYDEALAHIANQNIEIDLDDGVKVNYEKFQNVELHTEGQKDKKINLLKKI